MSAHELFEAACILLAVASAAPLLGAWMARVFEGASPRGIRLLSKIECSVCVFARIDASKSMSWRQYAAATLLFNGAGLILLWLTLILQKHLPFNHANIPGMDPLVALNAAVSFVTNTNWQAYAGETDASPGAQMLGFAVQNFCSAATGLAVSVAVIRGIRGRATDGLGNFWSDIIRSILFILLPLSMLFSILLMNEGVVQTLGAPIEATGIDGKHLLIPSGPVASQVAIKQLGSNGGGYFNANRAHPFENPTAASNATELFAMLLIPAACPFMYGRMIGSKADGRALFSAMAVLLSAGAAVAVAAESSINPSLGGISFMEGKEMRFGPVMSSLWAVFTTATSNGSVSAMHSSLSPLSSLTALGNMLLGEVAFGGVGSGLYGMLLFAILTVFICGLMAGRTPELRGRKIEAREVKLAIIAALLPGMAALLGTALTVGTEAGRATLSAAGPHGLAEAIYSYASMSNNNGSAFAGIAASSPMHLLLGAMFMLLGRFAVIVPVLAIAGGLEEKKIMAAGAGAFTTHGFLFITLLVAVILAVGALTFFPALTLGPVLEHFLMLRGAVLP